MTTPTQQLMLEVLTARHRLGEPFWPFDNNLLKQARVLEQEGLIEVHHGHVENTFRAELSPEGKRAMMDSAYNPPKPPGRGKWRTTAKEVIKIGHGKRVVTKVQEIRR